MISHRYRCIYVKVPKCASTSVLEWFLAHGEGRHSFRPSWYAGHLGERIQGLARAVNLYPHYATFSFVRNPYERFVSTWLHARRLARAQTRYDARRPHADAYGTLRDFAELCAELLGDVGALWGGDARAFLRANAARAYGPGRIRLEHLGFVAGHARAQVDFLPDCNPERLFGVRRVNADPLSFLGTVESLEADFARVARGLGLPGAALGDCNRSGSGDRAGPPSRHARYYDEATRRRVRDLYAADLAFTGCGFGERPTPAVRAPRPPATLRRPAGRATAGSLPARAGFRLASLEIGAEVRLRRFAGARGVLRPLQRLRRGQPLRGAAPPPPADGPAPMADAPGPSEAPPPPAVSVIVPARDAEATLARALESVLAQDYAGEVEAIVADGSEGAATGELLRRRFAGVRVVPNPGREIACGLNRALAAARHPVIARCDARAVLPAGYLTRAVGTLLRTGAANVGGRQHAVGSTPFERAVALATSTPLGAGDARYRLGGPAGPTDTVYLGVFRREALDAAGGFDERLLRNEDYELNWRLRERGGTVWFDPALAVRYRPRGTLGALARQYFDYGRWKRVMLARHPRALRPRQAAPALLLAALAGSCGLAAAAGLAAAGALAPAVAPAAAGPLAGAAAAVPLGYGACLIGASAVLGLGRRRPEAVLLPVVAATIHLAWAAGLFAGAPGGARRRGR